MIPKNIGIVVDSHVITQDELDSALYSFLDPKNAIILTDARKEEIIQIVKEAYKKGYRLNLYQ